MAPAQADQGVARKCAKNEEGRLLADPAFVISRSRVQLPPPAPVSAHLRCTTPGSVGPCAKPRRRHPLFALELASTPCAEGRAWAGTSHLRGADVVWRRCVCLASDALDPIRRDHPKKPQIVDPRAWTIPLTAGPRTRCSPGCSNEVGGGAPRPFQGRFCHCRGAAKRVSKQIHIYALDVGKKVLPNSQHATAVNDVASQAEEMSDRRCSWLPTPSSCRCRRAAG
jgi:hypothetical protein